MLNNPAPNRELWARSFLATPLVATSEISC